MNDVAVPADPAGALLALYDVALPEVYGYLLHRCGSPALAEDLTAETFLAAARSLRAEPPRGLSVGWLITVARNKLVDHWRARAREDAKLEAVADPSAAIEDPWDATIDGLRARAVLAELAPQHRVALTLRYVDDLSVPECAALLDRTVHATEALLVRARAAFRRVYEGGAS